MLLPDGSHFFFLRHLLLQMIFLAHTNKKLDCSQIHCYLLLQTKSLLLFLHEMNEFPHLEMQYLQQIQNVLFYFLFSHPSEVPAFFCSFRCQSHFLLQILPNKLQVLHLKHLHKVLNHLKLLQYLYNLQFPLPSSVNFPQKFLRPPQHQEYQAHLKSLQLPNPFLLSVFQNLLFFPYFSSLKILSLYHFPFSRKIGVYLPPPKDFFLLYNYLL